MGGMDARHEAIDRFTEACRTEAAVVAAFLGGSIAAGTADEASDVDIYAVIEASAYDAFFARRASFMHSWSRPALLLDTLNFEGLGFDMLHFVLADGVHGELALGHSDNFRVMHGGPHRVLVDKTGLLDAVTFTKYTPSEAERRQQAEHALTWFWLDFIQFRKRLHRRDALGTSMQLTQLRRHCVQLLALARDEAPSVDLESLRVRLARTLEPNDPTAAAHAIATLHQDLGVHVADHFGLSYPSAAAAVLLKD